MRIFRKREINRQIRYHNDNLRQLKENMEGSNDNLFRGRCEARIKATEKTIVELKEKLKELKKK